MTGRASDAAAAGLGARDEPRERAECRRAAQRPRSIRQGPHHRPVARGRRAARHDPRGHRACRGQSLAAGDCAAPRRRPARGLLRPGRRLRQPRERRGARRAAARRRASRASLSPESAARTAAPLFRVRAGPAASFPDFDALVERLRAAGRPDAPPRPVIMSRPHAMRSPLRILPALCLLAASAVAHAAAPPVPPPPRSRPPPGSSSTSRAARRLPDIARTTRSSRRSITKLMTAYAVFQALKDGKLKLDTAGADQRARLALGRLAHLPRPEHPGAGRGPDPGHDRAERQRRDHRARRGHRRHRGHFRRAHEPVRRAARHGRRATSRTRRACRATTTRCPPSDMARLARAIIREFPEYYRWYSQREFTWNNIRQPNRNGLLARDPSVDGVKTGMTDAAGYCLVSSAKRDGMRLVAVVAGTKSMKAREDASLALLNYGFNFYETRTLKKARRGACHAAHLQGARRARRRRPRAGPAGHAATRPGGPRRVHGRARAARVRAAHEVGPRRRRCARSWTARSSPRRRSQPLADVPRGNIFRRIWDTILSWFA